MRIFATLIAGLTLTIVILNACAPQRTLLEQVLAKGELRILTRHANTTYFYGPQGPDGVEYQLIKRFAAHLGVDAKIMVPDTINDMLQQLQEGDAHIAAAGLTVTENRKDQIRFAPPYQSITQQVIYHRDKDKPKTIADMDGIIEILAHSSHAERLQQIRDTEQQDLDWIENDQANSTELLTLVADGLIDFTVADSNEAAYTRRFYPELQVAFDITAPQSLAWAFPKGNDDSLYNEAVIFFNHLRESGELQQIINHNYQHVRNYDYNGTRIYLRQVRKRLPGYRATFEKAAAKYDLDWRLLAAVAYQESHWRANAVSPTGVRGLMMLTKATAKTLGIDKRTDPQQSIMGGAQYLRKILDKIPEDIPEMDRTWIALAAYNVGYGHVMDAQNITRKLGGNPNKWIDVKEHLPLLTKRKWYKQTRFGYARGYEPVRYVENIRSYYDILVWHLDREEYSKPPQTILAFSANAL